ncbi:MAG TPA: hypothetical protein VGM01_15610, partial [Ktedonobacteraceae bacterium]
MITEHTHSENNDWQEPGGEQSSASEPSTPQPVMDAPVPEEGQVTQAETTSDELPTKEEDAPVHVSSEEPEEHAEASQAALLATDQDAQDAQAAEASFSSASSDDGIEEVVATSEDIRQPTLLEGDTPTLFPLEVETSLSPEEIARPFTDFIEEFRQTEAHFDALLSDPETSFTAFVAGSESVQEPVTFLETAPEDLAQVIDDIAPFGLGQEVPLEQVATDETPSAPADQTEETPSGLTQPRLAPERPVSPLLRPATRPRMPRHGRHRIDELIHPAELRGDLLKTSAPTPAPTEEPVSASETETP